MNNRLTKCPACDKMKSINSNSGNCDDCDHDAFEVSYNKQADRQENEREDQDINNLEE